MPNIKSAIKRVKVSKTKNLQNRVKKSELRTTLRTFNEAIQANSSDAAELLKATIKKVDQAASKNLIHKNAASRKKSQLTKALNALSAK